MELFAKPRARLRRLAVLLGVVALSAAVAAIARADCGIAWTIGSASNGAYVSASHNDDRDGTRNLDCPDGSYVSRIWVEGADWGTYPSITRIDLNCRTPSREFSTVELGRALLYTSRSGGSLGGETCNGEHGALTGLNVSAESYIRDLRARCGAIRADASIDSNDWEGGWLLGHESSSKSPIYCGGSSVVSGLRLSYRDDGDEYAFTKVQLRCSRVLQPDTYAPTLSGRRHQSVDQLKASWPIVVRATCSSPCKLEAEVRVFTAYGDSGGWTDCVAAGDSTRIEMTITLTGDLRQRFLTALRQPNSGGLTGTITVYAKYTTGVVRTQTFTVVIGLAGAVGPGP